MNKKGLCQLKIKRTYTSDFSKVVYKITEENISVLNEYFNVTYNSFREKIEVGDLITKDLSLFDKNGTPKNFKDDRCEYEYDVKKNRIVATFIDIYRYVFIETEEEANALQKFGFCDAEKDCVMIMNEKSYNRHIISKKEFQKEYKILEENSVEEK